MLLTPSKPSWGPCQCSGAAGGEQHALKGQRGSSEIASIVQDSEQHAPENMRLYALHTIFKVPLDSHEHIRVGQILEGRFGSSCALCLWRDTKPHVPT